MCEHCMNRRTFHALTAAGLAGGFLGVSAAVAADALEIEPWDPDQPPRVTGRPLRVQPILAHAVLAPREKTSWRSWSEIINEPAAAEEMQRIAGELKALSAKADFPLEILPLAKVTTPEQAVERAAGRVRRGAALCRVERRVCSSRAARPIRGATRWSSCGTSRARPTTATSAWACDTSRSLRPNWSAAEQRRQSRRRDARRRRGRRLRRGAVAAARAVRAEELRRASASWPWAARRASGTARRPTSPGSATSSTSSTSATTIWRPGSRRWRPMRTLQQQCRRLDRPLPGLPNTRLETEKAVRPTGVRALRGVPAVAARAPGPGDHDQPVHGHDPRRSRTRPPACR